MELPLDSPLDLWAATGNSGKISEYKILLSTYFNHKITLHSQSEVPNYPSPEETGTSFEENSIIKSKAFSQLKNNSWVFAEDSGIEVDALDTIENNKTFKHPGIYSARFAGNDLTDQTPDIANNLKVLKLLKNIPALKRTARFKAVISLITPDNDLKIFSGKIEGFISKEMNGNTGFGYDSIFIPKITNERQNKTLAELGLEFKNKISHRKEAFNNMLNFIKNQ